MVVANLTKEHDCKSMSTGTEDDIAFYTVKASTAIYKGGTVCFETGATGYVIYGGNVAGETFCGVAASTVLSTDTDRIIAVYKRGYHRFLKATAAITDIGVAFYVDATATSATIQSGTSTGPIIGYGYKLDGTTGLWIKIKPVDGN
jgi:hypothetical protein